MKFTTLLVLLLFSSWAQAAQGILTVDSQHSVETTMKQLRNVVQKSGFRVFAEIDHAEAGKGVNSHLRPIKLLIFGQPKAGSLLMNSQPTAGIDLPMKYLIWQTESGKVKIGWNDPAWLAARHGISNRQGLILKMSKALRSMARHASR